MIYSNKIRINYVSNSKASEWLFLHLVTKQFFGFCVLIQNYFQRSRLMLVTSIHKTSWNIVERDGEFSLVVMG